MPEPGGRCRHRQDAETLATRRQQEAPDDERQAQREEGKQIAKHDFAQERRPIEREESPDAAKGEGSDHAGPVGEPNGDGAQAFSLGVERQCNDPFLHPGSDPVVEPLRAEAERDEARDQHQHAEQAALLELQHQDTTGPLELGRQRRHGRGERRQVQADCGDPAGEITGRRRPRLRRRGRFWLCRGGTSLRQPFAHIAIVEQIQQLPHLRRRVTAFESRCVLGPDLRTARRQHQDDRECSASQCAPGRQCDSVGHSFVRTIAPAAASCSVFPGISVTISERPMRSRPSQRRESGAQGTTDAFYVCSFLFAMHFRNCNGALR